ncbi:SDR family NAD(P)-dependent oxidoreductase [Brevibacillus reuszeri]|uniref:SDR family NAD(P)-dependent oxidoreductase n=1 Tax=Brevibacillus reuszeri TaxID=54915 RepID=UPI0028978779|nr:SDR family NAD(P)-dependent oxidoreductase [Brevibacillus reuszeri]
MRGHNCLREDSRNSGEEAKTKVLVLELDVTSPNQNKQSVSDASDKFGRIDVLFNNAGIGYFSPAEECMD